jgi:D-alanyl-D-alanine carboxypeptidase
MGAVIVGPVQEGARLLLTQRSSRLVDILKVLLCYSNNFMAERIGESLGGPFAVKEQLTKLLQLSPDEIKLSSLSGLGINRISPRVMMKIYRALRTELQKNKLSPSDILPVAGIDPGRFRSDSQGRTGAAALSPRPEHLSAPMVVQVPWSGRCAQQMVKFYSL